MKLSDFEITGVWVDSGTPELMGEITITHTTGMLWWKRVQRVRHIIRRSNLWDVWYIVATGQVLPTKAMQELNVIARMHDLSTSKELK